MCLEMHKSRGNGEGIRHNSEDGIIRGACAQDGSTVLGYLEEEISYAGGGRGRKEKLETRRQKGRKAKLEIRN